MKNLAYYFSLTISISLSLFMNGCDLNSTSIIESGKEKINTVLINESEKGQDLPISAQLLIDDQKIDLEVAKTPQQQQIGLMYRSFLPDERGMLFIFEEPIMASFWMKNVNISLDMIFLRDGVVDSIAHEVPPCVQEACSIYRSQGLINEVIELAQGRAKELNIKQGDRLEVVMLNLDKKN